MFLISENLDEKGNVINPIQPINQPIVPSGGTAKIVNDKIEKIQHDTLVMIFIIAHDMTFINMNKIRPHQVILHCLSILGAV